MFGAARELAARGVVALAFDQEGHGRTGGVYLGDSSLDVIAAAEYLKSIGGIDATRIGIMGHSAGAREAILAALQAPDLEPVVCTSTPSDGVWGDRFYERVGPRRQGVEGAVRRYPRDGALPWLDGRPARAVSWLASWLHGYRFHVDWDRTLAAWAHLHSGVAVSEMTPRPILFVHCEGDRGVPLATSEILFLKAVDERKDFFVHRGGWHSTPVHKGPVRTAWVEWLADQLKATRVGDGVES